MINRDFIGAVPEQMTVRNAMILLFGFLFGIRLIFFTSANYAAESIDKNKQLVVPQIPITGKDLNDCATKLSEYSGGWCEIVATKDDPSISSVWPENLEKRIRMVTGPSSILTAWNSAAYDSKRKLLYFMGGGHTDYGGNEVYQFDIENGQWKRLTDPSPLNFLYIISDYNQRSKAPWRRLCWIPDVNQFPGSSHTYDGLIFSHKTETLFFYSYGAANGSCIEDKEDAYKSSPMILGGRKISAGWYEFNPSIKDIRNGLSPLLWRKVFNNEQFKAVDIHQSYPASVELPDDEIAFGSKLRTVIYNPKMPDVKKLKKYTSQADWGDGLKAYDKKRNLIWSIHKSSLLAFDAKTGRQVRTIKQEVPHGKSLAINNNGIIFSWNGSSKIFIFDPDDKQERWQMIDWAGNGPVIGDRRVYGKWQYIGDRDLFVGISTHKTGVWIYKHPVQKKIISFSPDNLNNLLKSVKPGDIIESPVGNYIQGLFIDKSITLKLKNVSLYGVSSSKGIINVKCNNCRVVIEDFNGDGNKTGCLVGNCAGIKAEGKNFSLVVRRAHINGTVMGILTDNRGGEVIIEDSLIENTGLNDNSREVAHGVYIGAIDKVVVRNSTIRRPFGKGHIFKSRAKDTQIENSVLAGLDGRHSRVVDFPCGGNLSIKNSVIQQGEQTDNIDLISVGTEPKNCGGSVSTSNVSITNNWIIFDRDESKDEPASNYGFNRFFTWRAPIEKIDVTGNRIIETTGRFKFDGEDHVPDLSKGNQFYDSRKAAGLGPNQLPDRPSK